MSEIEEAIRKQMEAERQRYLSGPGAANGGQAGHPNVAGSAQPYASSPHVHGHQRSNSRGGLLGALAALGAVLAKFGAPLLAVLSKLKFLLIFKTFFLTGGSMLVSMWVYSTMFGWKMAVGFVLLIFVHESGHAFAAKRLGHPVGPMVFVPGMGAFVTSGRARNIVEDAFVGIMGPVFGTVGGLVCMAIYLFTGNLFWAALAYLNFMVNLFNLLPTPPLDGGWITPLFSPKLLLLGVILLFVVAPANPLIWILGFLSLPRIIQGWKAKPTDRFYQAPSSTRWKYAAAYLGLAAFLALNNHFLHDELINKLGSQRRSTRQVALNVELPGRS